MFLPICFLGVRYHLAILDLTAGDTDNVIVVNQLIYMECYIAHKAVNKKSLFPVQRVAESVASRAAQFKKKKKSFFFVW